MSSSSSNRDDDSNAGRNVRRRNAAQAGRVERAQTDMLDVELPPVAGGEAVNPRLSPQWGNNIIVPQPASARPASVTPPKRRRTYQFTSPEALERRAKKQADINNAVNHNFKFNYLDALYEWTDDEMTRGDEYNASAMMHSHCMWDCDRANYITAGEYNSQPTYPRSLQPADNYYEDGKVAYYDKGLNNRLKMASYNFKRMPRLPYTVSDEVIVVCRRMAARRTFLQRISLTIMGPYVDAKQLIAARLTGALNMPWTNKIMELLMHRDATTGEKTLRPWIIKDDFIDIRNNVPVLVRYSRYNHWYPYNGDSRSIMADAYSKFEVLIQSCKHKICDKLACFTALIRSYIPWGAVNVLTYRYLANELISYNVDTSEDIHRNKFHKVFTENGPESQTVFMQFASHYNRINILEPVYGYASNDASKRYPTPESLVFSFKPPRGYDSLFSLVPRILDTCESFKGPVSMTIDVEGLEGLSFINILVYYPFPDMERLFCTQDPMDKIVNWLLADEALLSSGSQNSTAN